MPLRDDYYTLTQVAQVLIVTRQTVARWNRMGLIKGERTGRELIFDKGDIHGFKDTAICPYCNQLKRNFDI